MLDLSPEGMRKEIQAFSLRSRALNEELQERSKLSSANRTLFDQIQQHKDRLEAKFSEAERAGSWNLIKKEFAADWNSLVVDLASLENQLCQ